MRWAYQPDPERYPSPWLQCTRQDSNLRPPPCKRGALPLSLRERTRPGIRTPNTTGLSRMSLPVGLAEHVGVASLVPLGGIFRCSQDRVHPSASPQGLEPQLPGSEPGVLPLNERDRSRPALETLKRISGPVSAPPPGLEPGTLRLTAGRSAIELWGNGVTDGIRTREPEGHDLSPDASRFRHN